MDDLRNSGMRDLPSSLTQSEKDRFFEKVFIGSEKDCWLWLAYTINGYGRFRLRGKQCYAHRVAWVIANGEIPDEKLVCHKCDTPPCVNPTHLFVGTHVNNTQDALDKGRMAVGVRNGSYTCPERRPRGDRNGSRTHPESMPRGENHTSAKLNEMNIFSIRSRYSQGETITEISKDFDVSIQQIFRIVRRRLWKHI